MVSIIIPIYNSEKTIRNCIESVLKQTYTNFELILINDGSTDKTSEICKEYSEKDNRIRFFEKDNGGVSSARNLALSKAKGSYIQFLDSDDSINSNMVEKLVTTMEREHSDMVICGYSNFYEDNVEDIIPQTNGTYRLDEIYENYPNFMFDRAFYSPVNKLYLKSKINCEFNEELSLGEDILFNLDYLKANFRVSYIPDSLYNRNVRNGSLNFTYRSDVFEIQKFIHKRLLKFIKENQINKNMVNDVYTEFIGVFFSIVRDFYIKDNKMPYEYRRQLKTWIVDDFVYEAKSKAFPEKAKERFFLQELIKNRVLFIHIVFFVNRLRWRVKYFIKNIKAN